MKRIRKSWLRASTIIALVVGVFVTLNAMKEAAPQQAIDSNYYWFEFTGQNYQQQFDPFSYEKLDEGVTLPNCQKGDKVCVIKALDDGNGLPIIHKILEDMIKQAIKAEEDNDLVKVKL